jgi:hypothetical protein
MVKIAGSKTRGFAGLVKVDGMVGGFSQKPRKIHSADPISGERIKPAGRFAPL